MRRLYLVLIEICNDHADKQGEANHAPQEDKNVDVDAMDLYIQGCLSQRRQIDIKSTQASCHVRRAIQNIYYRSNTMNDDVPDLHPAFE